MKTQIVLSIIPLLSSYAHLPGQSPAAPAITGYLGEQTAMVLQITPPHIDMDILVDHIIDFTQWTPEDPMYVKFQAVRPIAKAWINNFNAAGGEEIYVVFSLADYPAFFILTPLTKTANVDALKGLLQLAQPAGAGNTCSPIYLDAFHQRDNLLFFGKEATWQRLQNTTPAPRWRMWPEYARQGASGVKAVLMPSGNQKKVLKEMFPQLPPTFGSLSTGNLLASVDAVVTAVHFTSEPSAIHMALSIQTPTDATAAYLQQSLFTVPIFNQILQPSGPTQPVMAPLQSQLHYQIDLESLKQLFTPWFMDMRTEVYNSRCMIQLKNLGKAIALYQNDFEEANPPTLEALINTEDVLPKMLTCPKSQSPYIYRGNDLSGKTPGDMILIHDNLDYHKDRVHVLYADCHVKALTPSEFLEAVKRDNLKRKELNLPEKQP